MPHIRAETVGKLSAAFGLGVLTIIGAAPSQAAGTNLCVNKSSGTVRALLSSETACKNNESLVALNQQSAPQVIDGKGKTVGSLVQPGYVLLTSSSGNSGYTYVTKDGFQQDMLYYTSSNCSGTMYQSAGSANSLPPYAVVAIGKAYLPGTETAQMLQINSGLLNGKCYSGGGSGMGWSDYMIPYTNSLDVSGFAAPFSVTE